MATVQVAPIDADRLAGLHPSAIDEPTAIRSFLEELRIGRFALRGARNRKDDPETAYVERVELDGVWLRTHHFDAENHRSLLLLNVVVREIPYFLCVPRIAHGDQGLVKVALPARIYRAERRDRIRRVTAEPTGGGLPSRVALADRGHVLAEARIADLSAEGLGVEIPAAALAGLDGTFQVRFLDGPLANEERWARVRHRAATSDPGWVRLGLATSASVPAAPAPVERRPTILPGGRFAGLRRRVELLAQGARLASLRATGELARRRVRAGDLRIVEYADARGERLRALVDAWGETSGSTAVVIPPAWGRTKETLLPLARTVVETFRRAGEAVVVLRFDGIRKRGESYNDPECRTPGRENHRFTISQGVSDIHATLDFLERELGAARAVLVTFSASSIEGRRAVLEDRGRRLRGWVSVVGAPDLQSGLRRVSGGIDYVSGAERGLRFGIQELMGVVTDIDRMARDALDHRLAFLEDARREMAAIEVPVTWIHGRHDAWLDLDRVRDIMAAGGNAPRRLVEVPTGHQLRSSREAIEVFRLVAAEIGHIALGKQIASAAPDLVDLEARRAAERRRLPEAGADLRGFWREYLVGRDGTLGIELMNATRAYTELMEAQVDALSLAAGERVADLGSGTGPFPLHLLGRSDRPPRLAVDEIDYVPAALARARSRLTRAGIPSDLALRFVVCDLDRTGASAGVPFAPGSYDAVLASLLLSYVKDPEALLRAIHAMLRPGGRLVVSTLRPDADVSKLYVEGAEELRAGQGAQLFEAAELAHVDDALRTFLNDMARVLDLEERGRFRFWDASDLARLVERAGFRRVRTRPSFGDPPQAIVLSAHKP
jgi:SAM-dependent methyltransferase